MRHTPQQPAPGSPRPSLIRLSILTGLMAWATLAFGPMMVGGQIQPIPAIAAMLTAIGGLRLTVAALNHLARLLDWRASHCPTGKEGTARWGTAKDLDDAT